MLFKNGNFTPSAVAGAYTTGILPIKKYNHQSAVSDFCEQTMVAAALTRLTSASPRMRS